MHRNKKTKFTKTKKALGLYSWGIVDPAAVQDCTKFPNEKNVLQLVRHIINGVCYQLYEKRLEQQKGRPNAKC